MATVAVPKYLRDLGPGFYREAPPGHRFTLYLRAWGENLETGAIDWTTKDRVPKLDKKGQPKPGEFQDVPNDLFAYQIAACAIPSQSYADVARQDIPKPTDEQGLARWQPLVDALRERQAALASADTLVLDALSTAPFATGLGIEHPLENGFAFLNPYGLPYLPGSGVKGVLRKAAQELQQGLFGGTAGWTPDAITALFGLESEDHDTTHQRGVLTFWDVIPQIKGNQLAVEIMTPHQSHYLQGKESPHDSGSPNPISFLAVPAGSTFTFHIECDRRRLKLLAPELIAQQPADDPWRQFIKDACTHAFEWLGFGAKTAVGYGAMEAVGERERKAKEHKQAEKAAYEQKAAEALADRLQTWENVQVTYDKGSGNFTARSPDNQTSAVAQGDDAKHLRDAVGEALLKRFKKKGRLRLTIEVDVEGNRAVIHGIKPPTG